MGRNGGSDEDRGGRGDARGDARGGGRAPARGARAHHFRPNHSCAQHPRGENSGLGLGGLARLRTHPRVLWQPCPRCGCWPCARGSSCACCDGRRGLPSRSPPSPSDRPRRPQSHRRSLRQRQPWRPRRRPWPAWARARPRAARQPGASRSSCIQPTRDAIPNYRTPTRVPRRRVFRVMMDGSLRASSSCCL